MIIKKYFTTIKQAEQFLNKLYNSHTMAEIRNKYGSQSINQGSFNQRFINA